MTELVDPLKPEDILLDDKNDADDNEPEETTEKEQSLKPDDDSELFKYIDRHQDSCERFKIEINPLPRYTNYLSIKKLLKNKAKVVAQKIKLVGKPPRFAFVGLRSEADREKAIAALDGIEIKGTKLNVTVALPAVDPFQLRKRQNDRDVNDNCSTEKRPKIDDANPNEEQKSPAELLNDKVAPLWRQPYSDQLKTKQADIAKFLCDLCQDLKRTVDNPQIDYKNQENVRVLKKWVLDSKGANDKMICPLDAIVASPTIDGYRGKCEFSIGQDQTVGFRLGMYKQGTIEVYPVDECPTVNQLSKKAAKHFESYLKTVSQLRPHNQVTNEGHWKQLTVRTTLNDQIMLIAQLFEQGLEAEQLEFEKRALVEYFSAELSNLKITSIYLELLTKRERDKKNENTLVHLMGQTEIEETMNIAGIDPLRFKISPNAFFQINVAAAECLYESIGSIYALDDNTVLLDVCCGTGTIGLSLAKRVRHVYGFEIIGSAIEDAKRNAQINSITNIEFIEGPAESTVPALVTQLPRQYGASVKIVAIIDPPRAGLHHSLVKLLRRIERLDKLLYVSCEPRLAKQNLIDLSRPSSRAYQGESFVPTRAIALDMFPHTSHCELVLCYERLCNTGTSGAISNKEPTVQQQQQVEEEKRQQPLSANESAAEPTEPTLPNKCS